jgi:REP element-mobilizing transposase RayT
MAVGIGSRYSKNAGVVFSLRSYSFYAGTVGHVSEATVKRHIENQKGR